MNNLPADKNRRVLVIDDNRAIHDDFRKILSPATGTAVALDATEEAVFGSPTGTVQQTRFEIDSAYQGQEGLLLVKKALDAGRPYAMAFVDVRMPPGWDGVETTRKIWELDPDLQVVLCTAYSDYSWSEMFERLGHSDGLLILKKPFDNVEAFQLAHALTKKWWLHQQSLRKMEELESRVSERTQELAKSLSLLNATFESTTDGIVAVDLSGKVVSYNAKFAAIWQLPAEMLARRDAAEMRAHAAGQVKDSATFLQRIKEVHADPEAEGFDVIELKDGRTFERYIFPQRINRECVGSVINWRDITERKRAEEALQRSQKRLRDLIDGLGPSMFVGLMTPQGIMIECNRPALAAAGLKPEDVIGKPFEETRWWTHSPEVQQQLREAITRAARGEASRYDVEVRAAENHLIDVDFSLHPLRDETGEIVFLVPSASVITERKQMETALRESNEKFHQLADNITDAFWIRSPDMREVQYISPAFERIWGRSVESLCANPQQWADFILPEDRERVLGAFAALTGDTPSLDIEYRIVRPEGEIRWVQVRGFQVRDAADRLIRHIGIVTDITERKRLDARFRRLVDSNAQSVFFWNTKGEISGANDSFLNLVGYTREDLAAGRIAWLAMTPPEYAHADQRALEEIAAKGVCVPYEKEFICKDGSRVPIFIGASTFEDNPGEGVCFLLDLSERKRLEAQLFQSQKMETVGKLSGGIAHEFNSILTAIIGQSELLLNDLPPGNPLCTNATEIRAAAERAATLTRQLLAYGRKQILQPEILDLNAVLAGMESTLCHLMGRDADVRIIPASGLKAVKADAGQIEQVIMNMAMNAADAMLNGGKLTLETGNVMLDQEYVSRFPELKAGDYVLLAITDTGTGMSEEVKARVFEPFFTTKGVGQGTGLGLSTCYGIVKQSGGHISVYSEPGRGTTFKIYLPQVEQQTKIPLRRLDSPDLPRGTETILLVEDDPALREMAATLLRRLGYTVLAAANGIEALSLKQQRSTGHVDLLFTDVVMPHMSGNELADRVRASYPHTRILFTSAYTESAIIHQGVLNKGVVLLQKPFTPSALALKVREVLDEPSAPKSDIAHKTLEFMEIPGGVNTP